MRFQAVSGCNAAGISRQPGEVFDASPEDGALLVARAQAVQAGACPQVVGTTRVRIGDQAVVVETGGLLLHPGAYELDPGTVAKLWGRTNVFVFVPEVNS